jgi:hypothetical protein
MGQWIGGPVDAQAPVEHVVVEVDRGDRIDARQRQAEPELDRQYQPQRTFGWPMAQAPEGPLVERKEQAEGSQEADLPGQLVAGEPGVVEPWMLPPLAQRKVLSEGDQVDGDGRQAEAGEWR